MKFIVDTYLKLVSRKVANQKIKLKLTIQHISFQFFNIKNETEI